MVSSECSQGRESYFTYLPTATLSGTCADGNNKWVSILNQGTINEATAVSL